LIYTKNFLSNRHFEFYSTSTWRKVLIKFFPYFRFSNQMHWLRSYLQEPWKSTGTPKTWLHQQSSLPMPTMPSRVHQELQLKDARDRQTPLY